MSAASHYHLLSDAVQLSLRVTERGKLMLSYFGARLAEADEAFVSPACEWPLASTDFDSRGLWGNYSGEFAYHLILPDGTLGWDPQVQGAEQAGAGEASFVLADPRYPKLQLDVEVALNAESVLTLTSTLRNGTGANVTVLRALSAAFPLRAEQGYYLTSFRGGWSGENLFMEEAPIARGCTVSCGSTTGVKCAQEGTPGFVLGLGNDAQEEEGEVILGALAWSGNYTLSFKHSTYGHLFCGMGHDFSHAPHLVGPWEELHLPKAVLVYSDRGKGEATRRLHRHLRAQVIPRGGETRRILLNSWEGVHFDVDEATLHAMMEQSADLGAELFVLDDGWFGKRKDDTSSLGDWTPDADKLPHGLAALTEHAQRVGIDFGLWMEPEMICPVSELYTAHPELAQTLPGITPREERHQLVLDLANPAADPAGRVSAVLDTAPGISYVKWDCNRKMSDTGSAHLPADRQGNLFFDSVRHYYDGLAQLRAEHPAVTLQCCSAGGGRLDLGAAAYHEEFWLSDNTDAHDRLRMQWAASHFFPANALGCHVTAVPNCYTGRETSLKFRFDVALMGRLGLELDPRTLTDADRAALRERIALAKRLRPIVQLGELYRLVSPFAGPDCAVLYRQGKEILILAYTTERPYTDQQTTIPLRGLKTHARYRLSELAPDETGTHCLLPADTPLSGDYLLTRGLPLRWTRPHQSCVLLVTELP